MYPVMYPVPDTVTKSGTPACEWKADHSPVACPSSSCAEIHSVPPEESNATLGLAVAAKSPLAQMSTPVRDPTWAGSFDCSACGRKRLIAADFSKKMMEKKQKDERAPIKCKACVEKAQADERAAAAARSAAKNAEAGGGAAAASGGGAIDVSDVSDGGQAQQQQKHECAACKRQLGADAYNRTQLSKGAGKQRCRECVEAAEKSAASASNEKKEAALEEARKALAAAELSGNAAQVLKASSTLSALEGEKVTGLKPMVLGRGRGRGRGGGGSWRGSGK